jgi:hypothetical protein
MQYCAGQYADVDTLRVAFKLGLPRSAEVAYGAADSADLPKLIWLRTKQHCCFPKYITATAAAAGSLEVLQWLKKRGFPLGTYTSIAAASRPHNLPVLQYLHEHGCEWHKSCCSKTGAAGDAEQLQWLCDQGAEIDTFCAFRAAESGSVQVFEVLQQQGVEFGSHAMEQAAAFGHLQLCQWLRNDADCEWSSDVLECAAYKDSLELVRWLLDSGCDCSPDDVYRSAAETASSTCSVLRYLLEAGVHKEPERLSATLKQTGLQADCLTALKLLRQHGAAWPDTLYYLEGRMRWSGESLAWARAEGCTAPAFP